MANVTTYKRKIGTTVKAANNAIPWYYRLLFLLLGFILVIWIFKGWFLRVYNFVRSWILAIGSNITKEESQAISSAIYRHIADFNTDEWAISKLLENLTLSDYYKVQESFGIQEYHTVLDEFNALGDDLNLSEVLSRTLHKEQKDYLKIKAPHLPIE